MTTPITKCDICGSIYDEEQYAIKRKCCSKLAEAIAFLSEIQDRIEKNKLNVAFNWVQCGAEFILSLTIEENDQFPSNIRVYVYRDKKAS